MTTQLGLRILTDAIHADLYQSLRMLFEDRLGCTLYRPIGMDWRTSGVWQFDSDDVARQFLQPWAEDLPGPTTGELYRYDASHPGRGTNLVSLAAARDTSWDLVLATLDQNQPGLHALAKQTGATFGIQVGNQGAANHWDLPQLALLSVTTPELPGGRPWMPHVFYRQEFSLGPDGYWADGGALADPDLVATRVQCITGTPDYQRMRQLAAARPDLRWRWYGHCGVPDDLYGGNAHSTPQVAAEMHQARIAYHAKRWSDGYGHVVHGWFAIGRPVLGTARYYHDKLAGPLFVDGVTSYDLETHTDQEVLAWVDRMTHDDDAWRQACIASALRFREVVDFDAEADAILAMLEAVLP